MTGLIFRPDFLAAAEESALVAQIAACDLGHVEMRGIASKRRVAHFGWLYGYESWRIAPGPPIPDWMLPVCERLAHVTEVAPDDLAEALVTEYPPGAGIGWHRDAPAFGIVAAVSLAGMCRMRFQRGKGAGREVEEIALPPRSMYALTGEARAAWQHSIPPTKELRYSITFRTLRAAPDQITPA